MSEQLFLFTSLPSTPPKERQRQLLAPKKSTSTTHHSASAKPITDKQRAELHELRQRVRSLTSQVSTLEERYDAAWCVFHRRLDNMPDDGRGARSFAARFLIDVVREIHSPSTEPSARELASQWMRGKDIGGMVSVQEMCAFAGVEYSRLSGDMGKSLITNSAPRPSIRQL